MKRKFCWRLHSRGLAFDASAQQFVYPAKGQSPGSRRVMRQPATRGLCSSLASTRQSASPSAGAAPAAKPPTTATGTTRVRRAWCGTWRSGGRNRVRRPRSWSRGGRGRARGKAAGRTGPLDSRRNSSNRLPPSSKRSPPSSSKQHLIRRCCVPRGPRVYGQ